MDQKSDSDQSGAQKSAVQQRFGKQAQKYSKSSILSDQGNLDNICQMAEISNQDRILDVATGTGFLADVFATLAREVLATDLTAQMLQQARNKIGSKNNVGFALADVERLPFADGCFDAVSCRVAFHHFPHPQKAIEEMARVCEAHGRIIFMDVISSENDEKCRYQNVMEKLRDPSHVKHHKRSEIQQMLSQYDLGVVKAAIWRYRWNFDEWINVAGPSEDESAKIRRMMIDSVEDDKSGLQVEIEGEDIFFTYTILIMVISKLEKTPN